MDLNLDEKRWDIYPIGFDKENPDRVIVQAFAFTGERPVFLGTWSVDWQGNQSRIVSFNKNVDPIVSINGYKVIQDGIEDYQAVQNQEKAEQKQSKYLKKQCKQNYNDHVKQIKNEYEFAIKELDKDYKDEYRDYKN